MPKPEAPPVGYSIMSDGSVLMGENHETCPMDPFTLMLAQHMHSFVRARVEQRKMQTGEEPMEEELSSDSSEEGGQGEEDKAAGSKDLDKKETMDTTVEKETQKQCDKKKEKNKPKKSKNKGKGRYHKR